MKSLLVILCGLLATVPAALGQGLSIELVLDQEQYLQGETLPVKVRISNFSGQNLRLGNAEDWLTFTVEDAQRLNITRFGSVPVTGEFSLEPATTGIKKVNLAPYFDLTRAGRYYAHATVTMPQWGQAFETKSVPFDIIKGSSIWEQVFGVPGSGKDGESAPEIRRYSLVQTLHSKTIKLYFRLADSSDNKVFRVYPLGQMVSFSNPEPQLDQFSNLHVLYQTSGRNFMHCLINPDGLLLVRETYEYSDRRPVLRPEKDGRISVHGGTRRFMPDDLPPTVSSNGVSNAKPNQP